MFNAGLLVSFTDVLTSMTPGGSWIAPCPRLNAFVRQRLMAGPLSLFVPATTPSAVQSRIQDNVAPISGNPFMFSGPLSDCIAFPAGCENSGIGKNMPPPWQTVAAGSPFPRFTVPPEPPLRYQYCG